MANVRRGRGSRPPDRARAIRALEREGLFVVEWTDSPGVAYPEHAHPSREVRLVLSGSMTIGASGRELVLAPGDRVELEPDEPHWARVGGEGVRYLAGTDSRPSPEWGATADLERTADRERTSDRERTTDAEPPID